MAKIRVRAVSGQKRSEWVYQEDIGRKPKAEKKEVSISMFQQAAKAVRGRISQYGRFRYQDRQYGKIESVVSGNMEIRTAPMRLRNKKGEWLYTANASFRGAAPAVRIRSRGPAEASPWIYIQHEEV